MFVCLQKPLQINDSAGFKHALEGRLANGFKLGTVGSCPMAAGEFELLSVHRRAPYQQILQSKSWRSYWAQIPLWMGLSHVSVQQDRCKPEVLSADGKFSTMVLHNGMVALGARDLPS